MSASTVTASVLGIDIENFSSRDMDIQAEFQRDLGQAFFTACSAIGLSIPAEHHQGTGDGSMNIVTQDIDLAVLASDLPRELAIWLSKRNRTRTPEGRLRLRVALGRGQVGLGPTAWQGQTVVATARILDCQAGRRLLRATESASLVLLLSAQVFGDVVRERRRGLSPEDFVQIEIGSDTSEKGSGIEAWASLYERDRSRPAEPPASGIASSGRSAPPKPPDAVNVGRIKGPTVIGDRGVAVGRDYVEREARRKEARDD